MPQVTIKRSAAKALSRLTSRVSVRITDRIRLLSERPIPPGARKLSGFSDLYRIRIGDYRVVYQFDQTSDTLLIAWIGHRKDAYKY